MKEKYVVLNYHGFISLPTDDEKRPNFIEAGNLNALSPFRKSFTLEQINYINMRCNIFKSGRLEFEQEDIEELYEELMIDDEEVLTAEQILDIVRNPTKEKLERVVDISDLNTIDLFRGIVTSFKNLGNEDVSNRVLNVVNRRRDEIYKKPNTKTSISIKKTSDEVAREKKEKEIEILMSELRNGYEAEIKKLKADLSKAKKAIKTNKKTTTAKATSSSVKEDESE